MAYQKGDWAQAGLKKPSIVRLKLATMAAALLRHKPGTVTAMDLSGVDARLKQALRL